MIKITDVTGIGPVSAKVLFEHRIKTVEALASISFDELKKIPGFSDLRARAVKKAASDCLTKAAKPSAITATNARAQAKRAPVKQTSVKKASPIAQKEPSPLVVKTAENKKKVKNKDKGKDSDKKKKDKKKDKKKNGKNKDKSKK